MTFVYYEFSPPNPSFFSIFGLSQLKKKKKMSSYRTLALFRPNQRFTLCAISAKILTCVRTVVFVRTTLFRQEIFSSIITLRPFVLAAVMCPTYHPTHAVYIYLLSRAVKVSPFRFMSVQCQDIYVRLQELYARKNFTKCISIVYILQPIRQLR